MKCPKCLSDNSDSQRFCNECGTRLTESPENPPAPGGGLSTGSFFASRFRIIEEIGRGGMGRVYKAVDSELREKIAIKLLKPEISSNPKTVERFRNELKYARKIRHKYVCQMFDLNRDDTTAYITMEYVHGENLKSFIRQSGQLSAATTVRIARQICEGLAEAHRLGVIHRDLKPSNIMIDDDGNARVMDFGIARSLTDEETEEGLMIGTPEYMAPEQVEGESADQRSDIYSLGVVLYEMLTGKQPFEGHTPISIAVKHKEETPLDPRSLNPQIPDALNAIVLKCLEKYKRDRFQNADQILDALASLPPAQARSGESSFASQPSPVDRKPGASRTLLLILGGLLAVLFAGFIYLTVLKPKAIESNDRTMLAVLPFENLGAQEDEYFADGITDEITNRLAALARLGVISRTSTVQYKETTKSIRRIAEELNVDFVLEGSVRWSRNPEGNGRVRVNTQLVRVSDDTHIWSESYDRIISDIFAVQTDIAEEVARRLDLTVLEPERQALNTAPTENLEAYDFYLQGREHEENGWAYLDNREFDLAISLLERATELDPDFALAYVRQSYLHSRLYFFSVDRSEERRARSRTAVNRALEIDPDFPEAHWASAFYHYWCLSDYARAAEIFEAVQKVRPNIDPQVLGYIQRRQGKWQECVDTLERAVRINPRDTQIIYELGGACLSLHRFESAEAYFDRVLEIHPDHLPAQLGKITIRIQKDGDITAARTLWEALPSHQLKDYMGLTLDMLDKDYDSVLERLEALDYHYYEGQHFLFLKDLVIAEILTARGERVRAAPYADAARSLLETAVTAQAQDPRFHATLGLAYAYLGRADDAIREGERAVELHPVERDAAQGPIYLLNLARIHTQLDEPDKALDLIERLLDIPHAEYLWHIISIPQLRLDPAWDKLREHPRFRKMVE